MSYFFDLVLFVFVCAMQNFLNILSLDNIIVNSTVADTILIRHITADLSRVNHVLAAIDEDSISTLSDLLDPDVQYSILRNWLITA